MIGLGTIANTGAIVLGGLTGALFGKKLNERYQQTITRGMAVVVMFVGISGTLQEMLKADATGKLGSHGLLMLVVSVVLGAVLGEWWDIDGRMEQLGTWIRRVTHNENDGNFINAFVTASLTFCIGAMAIVGSIEDGIKGDPSILYLKAVLDGIFTIVLVASLGKGAMFSAIPILIYQGGMTLAAKLLAPVFTPSAMSNLSYVGNLLIFCVGWNLVHDEKKIRVANLLPSLIVAVLWALVSSRI